MSENTIAPKDKILGQVLVLHPGLRANKFDFVTPLPPEKLKDFMHFVNTTEMSEEEVRYLVSVLKELYDCTSHKWIPYACKEFRAASQVACREQLIKSPPEELNMDIVWVQTGDGAHHWMELLEKPQGDSGKERFTARRIIIDPTGLDAVNEQGKFSEKDYQPYFGLPQFAPKKLKEAYFCKHSLMYVDDKDTELPIETVPYYPDGMI